MATLSKKSVATKTKSAVERRFFQWTDAMSVGIRKIDVHHRTMLSFINDAYRAARNPRSAGAMKQVLVNLADYAKVHCSYEERLLEEYGYPLTQDHANEHRDFEQEIQKLSYEFKTNRKKASVEICVFLKNWLINHMLKSDKACLAFAVQKGAR